MTQRRVTATNQLSTVIDALQLGKKTGLLTVEQGIGETLEEGTMTFMNGQVVNATLGRYKGRDAATKMFSWKACRFSFVPGTPENSGQAMIPLPEAPTEARGATQYIQWQVPQPPMLNQDAWSRRPVASAFSKEFLDNVLHTLDRYGLSRMHRRLFLLIDGRRSIRDLATLIGRSPDETASFLADLEHNGFIHF